MNRSQLKKILFHPVGLLVLALLLRLPSLWIPVLDIDETQFAVFAQTLLDGGKPYIASLDNKPILTYLYFASVFALFGPLNLAAVHFATVIWVWLTALVLSSLGQKLSSKDVGRWTALLYVTFSAGYHPKFIAASITQLMNLPIVMSLLFFSIALSVPKGAKNRSLLFLCGLMTAVAFNFKYQGGILLPITLFLLYWFKKNITGFLWVGLGFVIGIGAMALLLIGWGVLPDYVTWSLKGSFDYIQMGRFSFWVNFLIFGGPFFLALLPLLVLAWKGGRSEKNLLVICLVWFVLTWIPVSTGGRFYPHYFLQLLPPLCLLAARGAALMEERGVLKIRQLLLMAPFILLPVASRFFFDSTQKLIGEETFEVHERVGSALKKMAADNRSASLFVWGFATPIYTFSGLRPASRFLWCDFLSGRSSGPDPASDVKSVLTEYHLRGWMAFWDDMKNHPPTFFVDTSPAGIHQYAFYPLSKYPALDQWVKLHYTPCNEIDQVVIYCRN